MPDRKQITGGRGNWPIFDRNWIPVCVGDRVRAQICTGAYGQTRIVEMVIQDEYYPYCQIEVPSGGIMVFEYSFDRDALHGYYRHADFEHGHEKWVEVIGKGGAN